MVQERVRPTGYEKAAVEAAKDYLRSLVRMFEDAPISDKDERSDFDYNARACYRAIDNLNRLRGI